MSIGSQFKTQVKTWVDEQYGYTITRPVAEDGVRSMYFTSNPFCLDGIHIIISKVQHGKENFFCLNYRTGEYVQLTDEVNMDIPRAYFDQERNELYYVAANILKKVHIFNLESEVIYEAENPLATVAITADRRYLITSAPHAYDTENNDHEKITFQLYKMLKIDLETGKEETILMRNFEIDHIQSNPCNTEDILYCARGYFPTHQRIWYSDIHGEKGGPIGPELPKEHRTHEYYTPDGKHIAYHGKFFTIKKDRFVKAKDTWGIMNLDGSGDKSYTCPKGMKAGHSCISQDGKTIIADGTGDISQVILNDEDMTCAFKPLFNHNSTMSGNFVHPHPSISPDGSKVVFSTDQGGQDKGSIYILHLKDEECQGGIVC